MCPVTMAAIGTALGVSAAGAGAAAGGAVAIGGATALGSAAAGTAAVAAGATAATATAGAAAAGLSTLQIIGLGLTLASTAAGVYSAFSQASAPAPTPQLLAAGPAFTDPQVAQAQAITANNIAQANAVVESEELAMSEEIERAAALRKQGQEESDQRKLSARQELSETKARAAAAGVDVTTGSALDLLDDGEFLAENDAYTIRTNAEEQADVARRNARLSGINAKAAATSAGNFKIAGDAEVASIHNQNYANEVTNLNRIQSTQSLNSQRRRTGLFNAGGTLLTGASRLASTWSAYRTANLRGAGAVT